MDGKVIVYAACLAIMVLAASLWSYTMDIDDAQKEVSLARHQLSSAEDGVRQAQAWIQARKEALALITACNIISKDNQQLRDQVGQLRQKQDELNGLLAASILRARDQVIGVVMPEVVLANGTVLRQVKVDSVDPEIAVLVHSEGVSKISTAMLPADLLDCFRFGFMPGKAGRAAESPQQMGGSRSVAPVKAATSASDSLVRLGMDSSVASRNAKKPKPAVVPPRDPERIKREGDPALWKSVERTSIGRAYIPGQGWLKVGADGPIPGSAR